jgi:hypothetical protein
MRALSTSKSSRRRRPNQIINPFNNASGRSYFPAPQSIKSILAFNQSREIDDISINNPNINKLINIIKPSETLLPLLQNTATETHPETTSLEINITTISLRPISLNIKAVLTEFADTDSKIRLKRQTLQEELTDYI